MNPAELYVPHTGWLMHEPEDEVARFLAEGWFEYKEQGFLWLYARGGDHFLDCGAHIGLFSVTAGRAMNNSGHILAVEPHPRSAALLEQNLQRNGITCAEIRKAALFSSSGSATFHEGASGKAAYSSLSSGIGITVETVTLDDLLTSGDTVIDFAKIDVEGAELEVIKGAAAAIGRALLPLLMIECTEANLQRFGGDTEGLFNKLAALGYVVCRFDTDLGRLVPRPHEGAIGYDNLFAAQDLESVNQRLLAAPDAARRVASDVLTRGRACDRLYHLSVETGRAKEEAAQARTAADEAFRAGGEANWRAEQAEQRAEAAEKRVVEARREVQASEGRAEQARKRAEEAAQSADEAFRAGGEANWRAEQAEQRAEAAEKRLVEARREVQASEGRAEEARKRAEEAAQSADEAFRAGGEANWRAEQAEQRAEAAEKRAEEARRQAEALLRSAE